MPEEMSLRLRHPLAVSLITALVTGAIAWGSFTTRVSNVERRLDADEQFRRDYVTREEFSQFVDGEKAQFEGLRSDLRSWVEARR